MMNNVFATVVVIEGPFGTKICGLTGIPCPDGEGENDYADCRTCTIPIVLPNEAKEYLNARKEVNL